MKRISTRQAAKPKKKRAITKAMKAALKLILAGKDPVKVAQKALNFHKVGAACNTMNGMRSRGYIDGKGRVTQVGRTAMAKG